MACPSQRNRGRGRSGDGEVLLEVLRRSYLCRAGAEGDGGQLVGESFITLPRSGSTNRRAAARFADRPGRSHRRARSRPLRLARARRERSGRGPTPVTATAEEPFGQTFVERPGHGTSDRSGPGGIKRYGSTTGGEDGGPGVAESRAGFCPRNCTATKQATAIKAIRRAYSTKVAPRSLRSASGIESFICATHCSSVLLVRLNDRRHGV